jgi:TP901 family phage tail tape measure protein
MSGKSGAVRAGKAFVELFADNSRLGRDLKRGVQMMRSYAASAKAIGQTMVTQGLKLAAPFAIATAIFVGFEDEMASVRAVTQATASQFKLLTAQAKQLGRTTSFTAKAVASAQTELGRSGFNPSAIRASTASILALARGTRTELATAAQIGADSLRAFRLEAKMMPQVADILVATTNNSSQGLEELFEALKMVGPVAADVGASMADTAAAIGVLANNGIKGSLAGTAMKRAYLNLANPAIRKKIEALANVSAVDSAGNLRPLASVITDIGKATDGMPNAKRLDIFSQIFGDRAVVAASAFAGASANFDDLKGVLDNAAGTAQRTSKIMDDTLGGSFRMLMSAAEGVAIAVGETIAPALRSLAGIMTKVAGQVTAFVTSNKELVIGLATAGAVAVLAGGALIAIGGTISVLAFAFSGLASVASASLAFVPGLLRAMLSPAKMATAAILGLSALTGLSGKSVSAADTKKPAATAGQSSDPSGVPDGLAKIKTGGAAAATAILPLVASFAGLRTARSLVGGVAGQMMLIPAIAKRGQMSMIANSVAARRMGSSIGKTGRLAGRTLAGGLSVAHSTTRVLTASSLALSSTLAKTGGILLGKAATGLDAASSSAGAAAKALTLIQTRFTSTGRAAVLASSALVRSSGRSSIGLLTMGRSARSASLGIVGTTRSMLGVGWTSFVAGLKRSTQALGGMAIGGYKATRSLIRTAAGIRLVSVVGAASTGLSKAANGMRALSMGALLASRNLGKAAKSVRSMTALSKIGGIATVAATMISGAAATIFAVVSSPLALFAGLAAGIVAASVWAVGGFDAMGGGLASMVQSGGRLFGTLASQGRNAFNAVWQVAGRSIGAIVQRFKAGDMQGAFRIAMAGIKLAFAETMNSFASTWAPVKVALVNGWKSVSSLFGQYFGGAISFVKSTFASFVSWFAGSGGAGSVSITTASIVGNLAKMWATGWSAVEGSASSAMDIMGDGWDTYISGITNAWHTAINFIQKAWTRLKGLFDSDIDVEAEVKDINREGKAHNEANTAERDRKINERAAKSKAAKAKRQTDLDDQLQTIDEDTKRKSEEEKKQVAAELKASEEGVEQRRVEFEVTLIDADISDTEGRIQGLEEQLNDLNGQAAIGLSVDTSGVTAELAEERAKLAELNTRRTEQTGIQSPIDAVGDVSTPAQKATETPTPEEPQQMTSTEALAKWKKARDRRDELKSELSGANENGGQENPYTSRPKEEIKKDFQEASADTDSAMDKVRQARAAEVAAAKAATKAKNIEAAKAKNGKNSGMAAATAESIKPAAEIAKGASSGLARVEGRLTSSTGTFSATAGSRMGASSTVMNRVAKAVEDGAGFQKDTASNTAATTAAISELEIGLENE